jgi:hypothetical protein
MRGMTDVSGLREIRSLHSTGKRGIPRVQSSAYLDLYVLEREKERLEKEAALLDKRNRTILKRLADIQRQTETLEKSASLTGGRSNEREKGAKRDSPGRKWRTSPLNY